MDEEDESMDSATGQDSAPDGPASAHEQPVWQVAPPGSAAEDDPLDVSEDELTRVVSSLSRQRDALAARRSELDDRERQLDDREAALSEREDHIGAREDAIGAAESSQSAHLDAEWQEKLSSFEETNRQYAEATTALADWAAELRGDGGGTTAAHESESPSASADDFPDEDF